MWTPKDVAKVLADVKNDLFTLADVADVHGVVTRDGAVDAAQTQALRRNRIPGCSDAPSDLGHFAQTVGVRR